MRVLASIIVISLGVFASAAGWLLHRASTVQRHQLDLPTAVAACQEHCAPDRAAWRYDGTALACACDSGLNVGTFPLAKRR